MSARAASQGLGGDPAAGVLAQARQLVEDRTFAAVRAWKASHPGNLAIGYMPIYVPQPLLEAMGCLAVGVFGGGDQVDIIRGDSYFQSYICHIPRSTVELGLAGDLDVLDGMLFPSICDVIRNLGGMWKLLFPGRYSGYLDLPQDFDPALGGRFYAAELRRIAGELRARGASPLTDRGLRRAIVVDNQRRDALFALDSLRRRQPWRVPASDAYLVARAGSVLPASEHRALLKEFMAAALQRQVRPYDNVRVVVVGAFCEQPPLELIRTLEMAGCDIVDDDFQLGLRMIEGTIDVGEDVADPLDALVRAYLERGVATASRYIADEKKGAALIRRARSAQADGVIFAAASFCEQPPLELIRTLEMAGCDIVDDDFQLGLRFVEGAIDETGPDPLEALARAYLERGAATASRYIGNDEKGAALVGRVKSAGADGVIFAAASFCDPALLDQPMLEAALTGAGIPFTSLKFSENTGQFQVIREQAGAFSDAVKLWGSAA